MTKPKALVSVINDLSTDQRVHKVCTFLVEQGYDVLLIGRRKRESGKLPARAYRTHRMKLLFEKGAMFYAAYNFRLFWLLLFRKSDLLVSNDLDTLLPNYLVSRLKRKRLVYDTHEYFTEVPELLDRPKVRAIWERIERFTLPKVQTIYTVNVSIAKRYEEKYGKKLLVVRNASPKWVPVRVPSKAELGIPDGKQLLIMQGAGLNIHRGVEEAVEMMKQLDKVVLLIVGDGDVIPQMKEQVIKEGLEEQVRFYGKRPYAELMHYTHYADLGLSLDQPTNPNYLYSLPNKVFDYIHATTPVVCSDVVEVAALVRKNDVGIVLPDCKPATMAQAIGALLNDPVRMEQLAENCRAAAETECWENETKVLELIYPKVNG